MQKAIKSADLKRQIEALQKRNDALEASRNSQTETNEALELRLKTILERLDNLDGTVGEEDAAEETPIKE